MSMMQTETHLCRSFDITVHEKALNGVGLGHNRFLRILLGVWTFSTSSSWFHKRYLSDKPFDIKRFSSCFKDADNAAKLLCDECLPFLCSTTSSSKSSSKISLPSSTYPVPSGRENQIRPLHYSDTTLRRVLKRRLTVIHDPVVLLSVLHHLWVLLLVDLLIHARYFFHLENISAG